MTTCKVRLCGLKPCDINYSTNEKQSDIQLERPRSTSLNISPTPTHHTDKITSPQTDYLNLHIKPLTTPTNSVRKIDCYAKISVSNYIFIAFTIQ